MRKEWDSNSSYIICMNSYYVHNMYEFILWKNVELNSSSIIIHNLKNENKNRLQDRFLRIGQICPSLNRICFLIWYQRSKIWSRKWMKIHLPTWEKSIKRCWWRRQWEQGFLSSLHEHRGLEMVVPPKPKHSPLVDRMMHKTRLTWQVNFCCRHHSLLFYVFILILFLFATSELLFFWPFRTWRHSRKKGRSSSQAFGADYARHTAQF